MSSIQPLAEKLRPHTLDNYIGQEHLVGKGSVLYEAVNSGNIPSMIFWGPPGVGKTTLAFIIAEMLGKPFFTLSAINSGVKDVRAVIEEAKDLEQQPLLFIDEIHRFSKSQQDSLLGAVEKGVVTLIGATTENPSFEVITPLLSRCQVYILKHLETNELTRLLELAVKYYKAEGLELEIRETEALMRISGGDARKLYNAIEVIVTSQRKKTSHIIIDNAGAKKIIQQNLALYDKGGEQHYDIISAFIKSMRGSDPNGAVYWLARMINGGEDPLFIARRMLILASEDIGNANPNALLLANACFDAVSKIGWPESRIILSQTAIFLATSPKSNASYMAIEEAIEKAGRTGDVPVPLHLRNAPTRLMKDIGYGRDYKYAHSYEGNFVDLDYLPDGLRGTKFYDPGNNVRENELRKWLKGLWKEKYNY
jgi:putative ATPase